MKVFLDTNILLDIIEQRTDFVLASSNVFDLGIKGKVDLYVTSLTFANCVYTARKNVGYANAINGLKFLKSHLTIATMNNDQCERALNSDMPDFEDMLQFEAAIDAGCEVIITRDKKRHYPKNQIPIMTPTQFMETFES